MKNFRDYIKLVSESEALIPEAAKKKAADKVFQQIVGPTPAARLAAELPTSKAIINGQTWEKVGNNMYNRQTNKVLSPEEFNKLRATSGQAPKPGTAAPTAAPAAAPAASTATSVASTASKVGKSKLAQRGASIKRFVQRNPKLATALGLIAGVGLYKAGSAISNAISGDQTAADSATTTPSTTPSTTPGTETPNQSGKPQEPSESDKLKAEIDALFKELDPVKDQPVPDELKRLRGKYEGSSTASNTVQQSGKPAAAKPSDPFADTYSKFDLQSRMAADAKK